MFPALPRRCPKASVRLREVLYRVPSPTDTMEEFVRFSHGDLLDMPPAHLRDDYRRVQRRLDIEWDWVSAAWLRERLEAIQNELGRQGWMVRP